MDPLINIITRFSREDTFIKNHYPSIKNQLYRNFNHIITFTTDKQKEFLLANTDPEVTTLCRCFPTKTIPGMFKSFYYKQHGPYNDLDFLDYKTGTPEDSRKPNWKGERLAVKHFPYNLFMLKAEQKVKEGWVMYLDDDDWLFDKESLTKLLLHLNDEDTLLGYQQRCQGYIRPQQYAAEHVYLHNTPPAMGVGFQTATFAFHSKYLEYTHWDEWSGGDFYTLRSLFYNIPKRKFIQEIITEAER